MFMSGLGKVKPALPVGKRCLKSIHRAGRLPFGDQAAQQIFSRRCYASESARTTTAASKVSTSIWKYLLTFSLGFAVPVAYFYGRRSALNDSTNTQHTARTSADLAAIKVNDKSTAPLKNTPYPYHDISPANLQAARQEIEGILGKDGIDDTPGTRTARSSSAWSPAPPDAIAEFVCYPNSTEEVSEIVKICHRRRIPITAFSGGTSFEGALASTRGGICIDFRNMNKILALHKDDLDVVVQPAVGWQDLNAILAKDDLFFPPDPGPGAQIGGMIATGCSGTNAYRYGTMKDWVISLTLVLADGTIIKTRHRPRKTSAGYDLTRLTIGSSGTLGLVTEATLKLTNTPQNVRVATIPFPDNAAAVRLVGRIVKSGLQVEALELLDDVFMGAINKTESTSKTWKETPTLFVKFAGLADATAEQMSLVKQWAKDEGIDEGPEGLQMATDPEEVDELWQARKVALWSLMATKRDPDDKFLTADPAVPLSRLGDMMDYSRQLFEEAGLYGSNLGHVGDGNYHTGIFYGEDDKDKAYKIISDIEKRVVEFEGTVSGEHGIGLDRRPALRLELGDDTIDTMRKIKLALDPHCLLNCDKIIEMPESEKKV